MALEDCWDYCWDRHVGYKVTDSDCSAKSGAVERAGGVLGKVSSYALAKSRNSVLERILMFG